MSKQKTFINGVFLREKVFDWGSIINMDIKVSELIEQLKKHDNGEGMAHFQITRRREVTDNGLSHNLMLNDYRYNKKDDNGF